MKSDFHIHTNFSDGVFSPEKIVDTALEVGLNVIAITDHDNILSYDVAQKHIQQLEQEGKPSLILVQGIEVNTLYKDEEIHILGYFPNVKDDDFQELIKTQQEARLKQTQEKKREHRARRTGREI